MKSTTSLRQPQFKTERITRECRRLRADWSQSERQVRHDRAARRQRALWRMLQGAQPLENKPDGEKPGEASDLWAVGAVSMVDLIRLAG